MVPKNKDIHFKNHTIIQNGNNTIKYHRAIFKSTNCLQSRLYGIFFPDLVPNPGSHVAFSLSPKSPFICISSSDLLFSFLKTLIVFFLIRQYMFIADNSSSPFLFL